MHLKIVNDKKLNWSYVKKVMLMLTTDTLKFEEPMSIDDIARLHFTTSKLLEDYYTQEK